jgi:microcompartment protein CcmK/EutM
MLYWYSSNGNSFLNIVDSEGKSKTLDDYALADVGAGVGMVEIVIVSSAPELMMTDQHWLFTLVTVVAGSAILLFPKLRGMWVKPGIR